MIGALAGGAILALLAIITLDLLRAHRRRRVEPHLAASVLGRVRCGRCGGHIVHDGACEAVR